MRALTKIELNYIERLFNRNGELIRKNSPNTHRLFYQGLNKPMNASERKMRQRIRLKAVVMAFDLAKIYAAGIMPCKRSKAHFGEKSAEALVRITSNFLICLMVTGSKEEAAALLQHIEGIMEHGSTQACFRLSPLAVS